MTKLKGFKKNRYELDKPVAYLVTFENYVQNKKLQPIKS
jgi:hypothetical protein